MEFEKMAWFRMIDVCVIKTRQVLPLRAVQVLLQNLMPMNRLLFNYCQETARKVTQALPEATEEIGERKTHA